MSAMLEVKKLNKIYSNGVTALHDINLTVKSGDFFALLGVNGAGKSTAIGIISGLISKTSGHVQINGYDINKDFRKARALLGVVPQEVNLNIFETCEQIMLNHAGFFGVTRRDAKPIVNKLLAQVGLWDKRNAIVRHLSGGMKRRLMIARALVHNPKLLILDEPTAGVDIEIRRSMWEFLSEINKQGTTIILTTHYLEEAESLCNKAAIIHDGKIINQTSMKYLLAKVKKQIFALDLIEPWLTSTCPFEYTLAEPNLVEIVLAEHETVNDLFIWLNDNKIKVQGMRNKTNRLETLLMDLIHK
jgi:ABC-2 type transport system ATP-binding protein